MVGLGRQLRGTGVARLLKPSSPIVKDRKNRKESPYLMPPTLGSVPGMKKGGSVKPGLWANINRRKKLGISRPKSKSTISPKAYSNMKAGFPKKNKN
jgi:hypothetical protein